MRWFSDCAFVEKTCIRQPFRNHRNLKRLFDSVSRHIALKGYSRMLTVAEERYAKLWRRLYGFQTVVDRNLTKIGGTTEFFLLERRLVPLEDAITSGSETRLLLRPEGDWGSPGASFG